MRLPELLAVGHFNTRVTSEAPVTPRRQVFVTGANVANLRLCRYGRIHEGSVRVWGRGVEGEGRGLGPRGGVCGRRGRLLGAVGRGGRGRAVEHFLIVWQQVFWYEPEIDGELRVVASLSVGDEVDLVLPALLLEALLGAAVLAHAAAGQYDDEGPDQPEPPEFIVVAATLRLSTAVAKLAYVALVVHPMAHQFALCYSHFCCWTDLSLAKLQ